MRDENDISEAGSLQLIESMINKAKNQFDENGHLYLLWGWVVLFCSIAHFILLHFISYDKAYVVWFLTWGVVIYQVIYLSKKRKKTKVRTYTDDIMAFVWLSFVVTMLLMGCILGMGGATKAYNILNPTFLALYGMPTFLSGIILRFRPLKIGGISCWFLSAIAIFLRYDYQLLLISAAMLVAWIIPGYLLRARSHKLNEPSWKRKI
jgi:hypothetical protein